MIAEVDERGNGSGRRHHDELRLDMLRGKVAFVLAEVVRHDRKAFGWNMDLYWRGCRRRPHQRLSQAVNQQKYCCASRGKR
jgi:hypothetical protein